MLNNKGQSLILFVVVLPILLLILVLVIDIGKIIVLKQEVDNINKLVIDYGLDNIKKENLKDELVNMINLNNNKLDVVNINIENEKIYVELNLDVKGVLSGLVNISIFDINSSYVGYIENSNKRIERVSGD